MYKKKSEKPFFIGIFLFSFPREKAFACLYKEGKKKLNRVKMVLFSFEPGVSLSYKNREKAPPTKMLLHKVFNYNCKRRKTKGLIRDRK